MACPHEAREAVLREQTLAEVAPRQRRVVAGGEVDVAILEPVSKLVVGSRHAGHGAFGRMPPDVLEDRWEKRHLGHVGKCECDRMCARGGIEFFLLEQVFLKVCNVRPGGADDGMSPWRRHEVARSADEQWIIERIAQAAQSLAD